MDDSQGAESDSGQILRNWQGMTVSDRQRRPGNRTAIAAGYRSLARSRRRVMLTRCERRKSTSLSWPRPKRAVPR